MENNVIGGTKSRFISDEGYAVLMGALESLETGVREFDIKVAAKARRGDEPVGEGVYDRCGTVCCVAGEICYLDGVLKGVEVRPDPIENWVYYDVPVDSPTVSRDFRIELDQENPKVREAFEGFDCIFDEMGYAAKRLGLGLYEAQGIFLEDYWPESFVDDYGMSGDAKEPNKVRLKALRGRIEHFLQTGE